MTREPKLELKATAIPGLRGAPGFVHFFVVYTDDVGRQFIARGGPRLTSIRSIYIQTQVDEASKTKDGKNVDTPVSTLLAAGPRAERAWKTIAAHMKDIGGAGIRYLNDQNGNSALAGALARAGFDLDAVELPRGIGNDDGPGWGKPIMDLPKARERKRDPGVDFKSLIIESRTRTGPFDPSRIRGTDLGNLDDPLSADPDVESLYPPRGPFEIDFQREQSELPDRRDAAGTLSARGSDASDDTEERRKILEAEAGRLIDSGDYYDDPDKQARVAAIYRILYPGKVRTAYLNFGEGSEV
jgi:hypothetical protein